MIAEIVKKDKLYTYKVEVGGRSIITSKTTYKTKRGAIIGFTRFNNSVKKDNIVFCNDIGCFHLKIKIGDQILAESINLGSEAKIKELRNLIRKEVIILKGVGINKMKAYINQIGKIKLNKSLAVDIQKTDDYTASISDLSLFTYGDDIKEVLLELEQELIELHKDLFSGKYKLAIPAIKSKSYLEKFIK